MFGFVNYISGYFTCSDSDGAIRFPRRSRCYAFVSKAGGQRFKYWADQIGHSGTNNGSPPLRYLFKKSCVTRVQ